MTMTTMSVLWLVIGVVLVVVGVATVLVFFTAVVRNRRIDSRDRRIDSHHASRDRPSRDPILRRRSDYPDYRRFRTWET